jgi:hypothetical protein
MTHEKDRILRALAYRKHAVFSRTWLTVPGALSNADDTWSEWVHNQ